MLDNIPKTCYTCSVTHKPTMTMLLERYPYRYYENGDRGWIEKFHQETRSWLEMYECDSPLQLATAMEDFEYTKWLDPAGIPCYKKNPVKGHQ